MWTTDVIPLSELRKRQDEVLTRIQQRPAILTQHGRGAAVLVSLSQWESIMNRLEEMDDALTMIEARGEEIDLAVPLDEVLAELGKEKAAVV